MSISKIKTKSLALSSVTSDIILNNTVKIVDLDPEVVNTIQDTKTLVQTNSSNWNYQGTDLKALSGNWESTYSTVQSNSATWNYQGTDLKSLSANWQSTFSVVSSLSGSWNTAFNTATSYQNVSSSFITNTLLQSTSSLLTPLILTNVLTGQLVTNTLFTEYQTTVSNITSTLLPSSIYQNASGNWQSTYSIVSSLSSSWDSSISNSYTHNNFLPLSGGTITENLSVSKNVIVSGIISASASNVRVNVINVSASRIFTDSDNNRVVHINTTTNPLSAIFPNSLSDGFNVAIMNTGTNNLILSATQLNSLGTIIAVRFGGVFVYKDSGNLFAVGRLS